MEKKNRQNKNEKVEVFIGEGSLRKVPLWRRTLTFVVVRLVVKIAGWIWAEGQRWPVSWEDVQAAWDFLQDLL